MRVLFDNGVPRGVASVLLIKLQLSDIASAIDAAAPGSVTEVEIAID